MTASARHILVNNEALCNELKEKINSGELTFEEAAKNNSTCPSGAKGGELGTFGQGQMVPEFDKVVFNDEVGVVHGPVKTQFGYHIIYLEKKNSVQPVSYEKVKEKIILSLKQKQFAGKIAEMAKELKSKAKIVDMTAEANATKK